MNVGHSIANVVEKGLSLIDQVKKKTSLFPAV